MNEVETYNVPLSRARITVVDRSYNVVRRPRSVLRSAAREINRERGGGGGREGPCVLLSNAQIRRVGDLPQAPDPTHCIL